MCCLFGIADFSGQLTAREKNHILSVLSTECEERGTDAREIFKECTEQLRDYLEAHPEMKSQFSEQQLEQIMNGEPYIKGYTWHHSEIPGKMQLVETKAHAMSGHTGGNSIWCGGIR